MVVIWCIKLYLRIFIHGYCFPGPTYSIENLKPRKGSLINSHHRGYRLNVSRHSHWFKNVYEQAVLLFYFNILRLSPICIYLPSEKIKRICVGAFCWTLFEKYSKQGNKFCGRTKEWNGLISLKVFKRNCEGIFIFTKFSLRYIKYKVEYGILGYFRY